MAVYFSRLSYAFWGRVVLLLCIPSAVWITSNYFTGRGLSFRYYAGVGLSGASLSSSPIIRSSSFRFGAFRYYTPDVYLVMFLTPATTGTSRFLQKRAEISG
jgi:hypothetical protein